jgi:hypothetical protein
MRFALADVGRRIPVELTATRRCASARRSDLALPFKVPALLEDPIDHPAHLASR